MCCFNACWCVQDASVSSANLNTELRKSISRPQPFGTLLVTFLHAEYWSLIHIRCLLPLNQLLIYSQTLPLIPSQAILSINLVCGTLTNALAKSAYIHYPQSCSNLTNLHYYQRTGIGICLNRLR